MTDTPAFWPPEDPDSAPPPPPPSPAPPLPWQQGGQPPLWPAVPPHPPAPVTGPPSAAAQPPPPLAAPPPFAAPPPSGPPFGPPPASGPPSGAAPQSGPPQQFAASPQSGPPHQFAASPQSGPPFAAPQQSGAPFAASSQFGPPVGASQGPSFGSPAPGSGSRFGPPQPSRRRRWIPVVAGVVVVLLLLTGGAIAWQSLSGDDDTTAAGSSPTTPGPTQPTPSRSAPASPDDEFDGTALNEDRWGIYSNGKDWTRDAVRVEGGILKITGTGRNPAGNGNVAGGVCWCKDGGNKSSGTWTVRARFDVGAGYGPALLLWPESDKAADGFATFGSFREPDRRTVSSMVMWGNGRKAESKLTGDFTRWHTYKVEWRAGTIKMSVDDQVLFDSAKNPGTVIPTKPMHLVIQIVVGPKDGVPPANPNTPEKVTTEIDWVRYTD